MSSSVFQKEEGVVAMSDYRWSTLSNLTKSNPRFFEMYRRRLDRNWDCIKGVREGGHDILAIDCEMCETATDNRCLVRLSIVSENGETLFDEIIKPRDPIINSKTELHGITIDQIQGSKFDLNKAKAALQKLCHQKTILIGHSLNCDLKALRIQHVNVIDTALLFGIEGEAKQIPSMRDIFAFVSHPPRPSSGSLTHDSVWDANAALTAVKYLMNHPDSKNFTVKNLTRNGHILAVPRIDKSKCSHRGGSSITSIFQLPKRQRVGAPPEG